MKKDVKLYNMILPPFMLFFFVPFLWIVSALGNFIIDSIVLLIISIFIYKKFTWQLYKKSIIPVFLYGFLSDFLGVLYLMAISIGSGAKYYEGTISENKFFREYILQLTTPVMTVSTEFCLLSAVFCLAVFLFLLLIIVCHLTIKDFLKSRK